MFGGWLGGLEDDFHSRMEHACSHSTSFTISHRFRVDFGCWQVGNKDMCLSRGFATQGFWDVAKGEVNGVGYLSA